MSLKFALALLDNQFISDDQFIDLVRIRESTRIPAAGIALSQNLVTIQQAKSILKQQEQTPNKSFGEVAIDLGFWDSKNREKMTQIQDMSRRSIRQIAIEQGICTAGQAKAIGRCMKMVAPISSAHKQLPSPKFSRKTRSSQSVVSKTP